MRRKAEDEGECVWCVYVRERQKETGVQSDRGKERERERGGVTGSGRAEIGRGEEREKRRERERERERARESERARVSERESERESARERARARERERARKRERGREKARARAIRKHRFTDSSAIEGANADACLCAYTGK